MASIAFKIIHVLFIRTLFYRSYINHAPMLKNDSRLAALPKTAEFQIVSVFENTLKTEYTNPGRLFAGATIFHMASA